MRSSKGLWGILGTVSLLSTVVLFVGFIYAAYTVIWPSTSTLPQDSQRDHFTTPVQHEGEFHLVALGDSLTKGTGDVTGLGYVGHVKNTIEPFISAPVFVLNFAIDGYRSDQLLQDLRTRTGDQAAVAKANAIMLTVGANDVLSLESLAEQDITLEIAMARMQDALQRLGTIFQQVRKLNPDAPIYYIGLYNPFKQIAAIAEETTSLVQLWNHEVQKLSQTVSNIIVIPTEDLFAYNATNYLAADQYHPNELGYARIAARVVQVLQAQFGWEVDE